MGSFGFVLYSRFHDLNPFRRLGKVRKFHFVGFFASAWSRAQA